MALDLVYLESADADLAEIYHWLAARSDASSAFAYVSRIEEACGGLSDFPRRGSPHEDLAPGLRSIPFERRATIYYRVTGRSVEIVRILYAGRDPARVFADS